jgi:hypothetical protein
VSSFGWQAGGYVGGDSYGGDPYIHSAENLGFDITNNKFIKVKFKNTSASTAAQIYFITTTDGLWNEAKHKDFIVIANSDYTEYTVDMSSGKAGPELSGGSVSTPGTLPVPSALTILRLARIKPPHPRLPQLQPILLPLHRFRPTA